MRRSVIVKRCQQLYAQILVRPFLHTLVSWRFFLPEQTRAVQLHRQVFLKAWPRFPRWVWALIFIYSSVTWLLWHSWRQIYRNYQKHHKTVAQHSMVSPACQLAGLFKAAFLHGIPGFAFYQYKLYCYPEQQWLNFVYTHELPQWHLTMSPNISTDTHRLLSDKVLFSRNLSRHSISTVASLKRLSRGQPVSPSDLFIKQSCFVKPGIGSRSEGCLTLNYQLESDSYQLTVFKTGEVIEESGIVDYINQQVQHRDYLIQPLLTNHPLVQQYTTTKKLITLRLISACSVNQKPVVVSALLEIPSPDNHSAWWLIAIDCRAGCFIDSSSWLLKSSASYKQALNKMGAQVMPFWSEITELCLKAHCLCANMATIGWDVVVTPDGVQLLEGNINWGIAQHQIINDKPILDSGLCDIYCSHI
ncbi:MAG TPA: hypothetical protein ENJ32_05425 [Crenotrichaceae bacterium]|nr:hypothetical protein [Crenotrichaceae bacterium]